MLESLARSCTLVIPTFNRPELLGRLLRYLELQSAPCPVLVLDSSAPADKSKNAAAVAAVKLNVTCIEYDPALPPFAKFLEGMRVVDTPFMSLCADDDVVVVPALAEIVDFMERNEDYSVAHGYYFNFLDENHRAGKSDVAADSQKAKPVTKITSLFYHSPSLNDADPFERLIQFFRRYEALTYGVYRTPVAREVYELAQPVASILARELLTGALTVAAGKTARLKTIYYGRNTGPSARYKNWHPLEWLATDPSGLFGEYMHYRSVLKDYLVRHNAERTEQEVARLIDLIHLRYLIPFLRPDFLDFVLRKNLEKLTPEQMVPEVWKYWNQPPRQGWRARISMLPSSRAVNRKHRRYLFQPGFLQAGPAHEVRVTDKEIDAVVNCLSAYSLTAAA